MEPGQLAEVLALEDAPAQPLQPLAGVVGGHERPDGDEDMGGARLADHALAGRSDVDELDDVEPARALDDAARPSGLEPGNDLREQGGEGGGGAPVEQPALGRARAGRMAACEFGEGRARPKAREHVLGRRPRRGRVVRVGDEDVAEEILLARGGRPVGPGQETVDLRVGHADPAEDLPLPQALRDEVVADPFPEFRERDAARLERAAQIRDVGGVPPGNGFDGPIDEVVRDAKTDVFGDAKLEPFEDQLVQGTANQRIAGGKLGGGLSNVEDELVEPSLDLAHQDGVAVDHRRDPVQLRRRRGRRGREEKGGDGGERDAERAERTRVHGGRRMLRTGSDSQESPGLGNGRRRRRRRPRSGP